MRINPYEHREKHSFITFFVTKNCQIIPVRLYSMYGFAFTVFMAILNLDFVCFNPQYLFAVHIFIFLKLLDVLAGDSHIVLTKLLIWLIFYFYYFHGISEYWKINVTNHIAWFSATDSVHKNDPHGLRTHATIEILRQIFSTIYIFLYFLTKIN